jgi:hypothetical protein
VVANALLRLPPHAFPDEHSEEFDPPPRTPIPPELPLALPLVTPSISTVLGIQSDPDIISAIKKGYTTDEICKRVANMVMIVGATVMASGSSVVDFSSHKLKIYGKHSSP